MIALAVLLVAAQESARVSTFVVPRRGTTLVLRDLTADGRRELLVIDEIGSRVHLLGENGEYGDAVAHRPWPDASVAWDVADIDSDGQSELLIASESGNVHSVSLAHETSGDGWTWSDPEPIAKAPLYIAPGIRRLRMARDLDDDGRVDLALPSRNAFTLYLNEGSAFSDPVTIRSTPRVDHVFGDPKRLSGTFESRVRIPLFTIRDYDGDGRPDISATAGKRIAFHIKDETFPTEATWVLDLSNLRWPARLSDVDLDDLLSFVSGLAQWRIADLDGRGANDLIVASDGEFRVWRDAARSGPEGPPDQILRTSGNVLRFFLRDSASGGRPNLEVVRGEEISIARLMRFLLVPGTLDFEVLVFPFDGDAFTRRPEERRTVALRVPRLLTFLGEIEEIGESLEAQWDIPAKRLDWDGDGTRDDVVDVAGGRLRVFENCAPPEAAFEALSMEAGIEGLVQAAVLEGLDEVSDGETLVIDLGSIDTFAAAPGAALRSATKGTAPVLDVPVLGSTDDDSGWDERVVRAVDVDGDGRVDLITTAESDGTYAVQIVVRTGDQK